MAPGTTVMSVVYCEMLNNLLRLIENKRRGMLTKGVILLHDNAQPHTAACTNALIKLFNWEMFDHLPYSPDLAPSNHHLFSKMKVWLATQCFHNNQQLMDGVNSWLRNLVAPLFDDGLQKLVSQYHKCLNVGGNCVEK
jgi:transposase